MSEIAVMEGAIRVLPYPRCALQRPGKISCKQPVEITTPHFFCWFGSNFSRRLRCFCVNCAMCSLRSYLFIQFDGLIPSLQEQPSGEFNHTSDYHRA
jgi:hypothetical protein